MAIEELNDLLNLVTEQDRAQFSQILERNTVARTRLQTQDLIYKGVLDGDTQAMEQLARQNATAAAATAATASNPAQPATVPATSAAPANQSAASIDLKQIEQLLDSRLGPIAKRLDTDLAETKLEEMFDKFAAKKMPALLSDARSIADELYLVRDSHKAEFGENLDRAEFEKFVNEHPNMYKTWASAHDAFVQDKRIAKKIEQGVAEKLALQQTNNVPGTTIPTTSNLSRMMAANPANKVGSEGRGPALTDAAAAFRALRSQSQA